MARFHVLDRDGHWQTGAWGFAELWSHLPTYRWLARVMRMTRVIPIIDLAYTRFARWRVSNRCEGAACIHTETSSPDDDDKIRFEPPDSVR
jgi:predicted DCC family thiol-disulfide oxidoreductase YuxK